MKPSGRRRARRWLRGVVAPPRSAVRQAEPLARVSVTSSMRKACAITRFKPSAQLQRTSAFKGGTSRIHTRTGNACERAHAMAGADAERREKRAERTVCERHGGGRRFAVERDRGASGTHLPAVLAQNVPRQSAHSSVASQRVERR